MQKPYEDDPRFVDGEFEWKWTDDGNTLAQRAIIRDVKTNGYGAVVGRCGKIKVGFTWATRLWFWDDEIFGGYVRWYRVER